MSVDTGRRRGTGTAAPAIPVAERRAAGSAALLAAAVGLLYSISFVLVTRANAGLGAALSAAFLGLGGLLGAAALLGLHRRVSDGGLVSSGALALALGGALAATIHGGHDLALALHPAGSAPSLSEVDPRGLGTFGLAGLAILGFSALMRGRREWPRGLVAVGFASGVLLVLIYLARLIILDPTNPAVLGPAAVEGFVVNPVWYAWLGLTLRR